MSAETPAPSAAEVEALAEAQSLVAAIFASWGVRSRHGEWTDTETQNAAAKEVLRSLLASGLVVSPARHAAEVQAARAEALRPFDALARRCEALAEKLADKADSVAFDRKDFYQRQADNYSAFATDIRVALGADRADGEAKA